MSNLSDQSDIFETWVTKVSKLSKLSDQKWFFDSIAFYVFFFLLKRQYLKFVQKKKLLRLIKFVNDSFVIFKKYIIQQRKLVN